MKAMSLITAILGVFVAAPIALYLQYKILTLVSATELMWFLFWVNIPIILLIRIVSHIIDNAKE